MASGDGRVPQLRSRVLRSLPLLVALAGLSAASSCTHGGGSDSPFPDDLPSPTEVVARAYAEQPLLEGLPEFDPWHAPSESWGGDDVPVRCIPVTVPAEGGGLRFTSAESRAAAESAAGSAALPAGFVEAERRTDEAGRFWDIALRGTIGTDPVVYRIRVLKRERLDTRKAWGGTESGRDYAEASRRLLGATAETIQCGTPSEAERTADGLEVLALLDWWLRMRGVLGANLVDATRGTADGGPVERIRFTQRTSGAPDQIYLCEAIYSLDSRTFELTASLRPLAQYAGQGEP